VPEYLPTYVETVRWSDREKATEKPLFPGYLFARFDAATGADAIKAVRGVVQILSTDSQPYPISDDEIANLRTVIESNAPVMRGPYVAGERVRVEKGPFAGVEGVISRIKGATLLSIPVEILGRSVSVSIESSDVSAQ
jgi:transcription antitermination factor NusG